MKIITIDSLPDVLQSQIKAGVDRTVCPACGGGSTHEVSLSIRDVEGGLLKKLSCWRASCGFWGFVSLPGAAVCTRKMKQAEPFSRPTVDIHGQLADKLELDYGLSVRRLTLRGWRMEDCLTPTLVIPIRAYNGDIRGHITRTFEDPKRVFTFKETARPFVDYWPQMGASKTVIVEDCLSAARLHQLGYTAVSLMGTNMSVDDAREINFYSPWPVYLALDRDAFDKSLKLAKRHRHVLNMQPICLDKDIKNMQHDSDILRLFGDADVRRDDARSGSVRESQSL